MAEKIKILMSPDYPDALFWDEEGVWNAKGCCIGGYDTIWLGEDNNEIEIDLSSIDGLKEWFIDWDNKTIYPTDPWTDSQWREWWAKGLEFARAVNELLPDNVELKYFTLKDPVWKARPEDCNDGGLFNYGEPIKIE